MITFSQIIWNYKIQQISIKKLDNQHIDIPKTGIFWKNYEKFIRINNYEKHPLTVKKKD